MDEKKKKKARKPVNSGSSRLAMPIPFKEALEGLLKVKPEDSAELHKAPTPKKRKSAE